MQFLCQSWCMALHTKLGDCPRCWAHFRTRAPLFWMSKARLWCVARVHLFGATRLSHQLGAEPDAEALQAVQQLLVGRREQRRVALHTEVDVTAIFRMIDAREAEHLDAGMVPLDLFHQRCERC